MRGRYGSSCSQPATSGASRARPLSLARGSRGSETDPGPLRTCDLLPCGMPPDRTPTIKRLSLVRLRRDMPRETCLQQWFGPHADIIRRLTEVREYTVDVAA